MESKKQKTTTRRNTLVDRNVSQQTTQNIYRQTTQSLDWVLSQKTEDVSRTMVSKK